jgi:hypothetical protein
MSEQSYIVRIYRRNGKTKGNDGLDGIVEIPESGQRAAFHDAQGLWSLLAHNEIPKTKQKHTSRRHKEC